MRSAWTRTWCRPDQLLGRGRRSETAWRRSSGAACTPDSARDPRRGDGTLGKRRCSGLVKVVADEHPGMQQPGRATMARRTRSWRPAYAAAPLGLLRQTSGARAPPGVARSSRARLPFEPRRSTSWHWPLSLAIASVPMDPTHGRGRLEQRLGWIGGWATGSDREARPAGPRISRQTIACRSRSGPGGRTAVASAGCCRRRTSNAA